MKTNLIEGGSNDLPNDSNRERWGARSRDQSSRRRITDQRALHLEPNWLPARRMLVLANALVGRIDEAQEALRSLLVLNPDETSVPFPFKGQECREKWRTGFRIAGLEE